MLDFRFLVATLVTCYTVCAVMSEQHPRILTVVILALCRKHLNLIESAVYSFECLQIIVLVVDLEVMYVVIQDSDTAGVQHCN